MNGLKPSEHFLVHDGTTETTDLDRYCRTDLAPPSARRNFNAPEDTEKVMIYSPGLTN